MWAIKLSNEEERRQYCIECGSLCLNCEGHPSNCISCYDGYYLEGSECKKCVSPCSKCLDATTCTECGFGESLRIKPPTCHCIVGYKDITSSCEECPSEYKNCGGVYGITCQDTYFVNNNVCESCKTGCRTCLTTLDNCSACIDGYYLEGTSCLKCQYPCQK